MQIHTRSSFPSLLLATLLVGVGAGFLGMLVSMLLHAVQHLAYGYSLHQVISDESFLAGVRASSPLRRVLILMLCGLIAGFGWWGLYRYGKPLVSIPDAVKFHKVMPRCATTIHVILQMVTIALGSPLGREVAPREIAATFAYWISSILGLSRKDTRIMLACGAGAGLAAVYNVPLAGALFTLEVLLNKFSWSVLVPAITTAAIAVLISWIGLGNAPFYQIPHLFLTPSLVAWSFLMGPLFGYLGDRFTHVAAQARKRSQHDWRMPLFCFINFTMIGFLSIVFPSLLGNGKSPAQLEFDDNIGLELSLTLLILRTLICWSSFRAGAQGGLLTPSLANGALLAVVLGECWCLFWPGTSLNAFALVGSTAFLASAQKMPLTSIMLILEFTHVNLSLLIPIMLAVSGATGMSYFCKKSTR